MQTENNLSHISVKLDEINGQVNKLGAIEEQQGLLEDSISNKYNQLTNTIGKIHSNVKSSNKKFSQLYKILENSQSADATFYVSDLNDLNTKLDLVLEKLDDNNLESEYKVREFVVDNTVGSNEYKSFINRWFANNIKITKNPHDVIELNDIKSKLDVYIDTEDIFIDKKVFYDRLENYLHSWYNTQNRKKLPFNEIKNESINHKTLYSYIKFINMGEEKENKIKNSIIAWIDEHTCAVEGSKTYTEDILRKIKPLFESNGWIITGPDDAKKLQEAGYNKVCVKRTFSQIIGKAVQEHYNHITPDTIQKDQHGTANITWYPNIEIIDRKVSEKLESTLENELNDSNDSDNIICNWLRENITVTGKREDSIAEDSLMKSVAEYLQSENITITEETHRTLFDNILKRYLDHHNITQSDNIITGIRYTSQNNSDAIIRGWMNNHICMTGENEDIIYFDELDDALITVLYHEGINVVMDDIYEKLEVSIRSQFVRQKQFKQTIKELLETMIPENQLNDTHITGAKITRYRSLTTEDITQWVEDNMDILLKSNVSQKKFIVESFEAYLEENNTRNMTQKPLEELLENEIMEYYNRQNTTFKLLNDTQDEYYVIIA